MKTLNSQLESVNSIESANRDNIDQMFLSLDQTLSKQNSFTKADLAALSKEVKGLNAVKKYNDNLNSIYDQYSKFGKALDKTFPKEEKIPFLEQNFIDNQTLLKVKL